MKFISLVVLQEPLLGDLDSHRQFCSFSWSPSCGILVEVYCLNVSVMFDIMFVLEISNDDISSNIWLGSNNMIILPRFWNAAAVFVVMPMLCMSAGVVVINIDHMKIMGSNMMEVSAV